MEFITLALFCALLLLCVIFNFSILYALVGGLVLFLLYGKRKGFTWRELAIMAVSGVKTVKNVLITFLLIGMLTALWRETGTIPVIVCYATKLIQPSLFLVMAFLLNCLVSFMTGTAFGTAATMGVICTTIASTMHMNPVLVGGAVLSGVYFGDRCSPVSTSALLVSELTKTNIFQNIKNMFRSAAVPFLIACTLYLAVGFLTGGSGEILDLQALFGREFVLSPVALLPGAVILILSLMQVNVKIAMAASILVSLPICILVQRTAIADIPHLLLFGYQATDPEVATMLNGGGIKSMLKVASIVCLSSSYSGIFRKTGLLDPAKHAIRMLSERATPYIAMLCTSVVAGMIACNQTLTIMLTHQLCSALEPNEHQAAASNLEDTAVVIAPLVPWSIAGAVPLASVGAPTSSILFACFLYLLPLWRVVVDIFHMHKTLRSENRLLKEKLNDIYRAAFGLDHSKKE